MKKNINKILIFLDQSIVSLGNFLITILLLKFLGLNQFGIFSFFWIFLLLIQSLQLAYIISPMLSNIPFQNNSNIKYFYGGIFFQQILLCLIIFFLIFIFLKYFFNIFFSYNVLNLYLPFIISLFLLDLILIFILI